MPTFTTPGGAPADLLEATGVAVEAATRAGALRELGVAGDEVAVAESEAAEAQARMRAALERLAAGE